MVLGIDERIDGVNLATGWCWRNGWIRNRSPAAPKTMKSGCTARTYPSGPNGISPRNCAGTAKTYITLEDFRIIVGHGINLVRIPIPYFIFGDWPGHPGCITYLDRAFRWARETGLKIMIDLHTVPESQNGFDNGGLTGVCKWRRIRTWWSTR